jgi:hypothetical protein
VTEVGDDEAARQARFSAQMRRIALAVLVLGLSSAGLVLVFSSAEDAAGGDAAVASINESKQYQLAMERVGGKAVLVAAEINDWFAGLWHGRRLAATLTVLSVVVSWVCWWVGRLPPP